MLTCFFDGVSERVVHFPNRISQCFCGVQRTEASVRIAKSMKIVSIARAEMWSQSMNPSAYAIGSHLMTPESPAGTLVVFSAL